MMYSAFVFESDSWCNNLTPGIFLPCLPTLMPSPTSTSLPLTRTKPGNTRRTAWVQVADKTSSLTPVLCKLSSRLS